MKGLEGKLGSETSSVVHNLGDLGQDHPISAPKRPLLDIIMNLLVLCAAPSLELSLRGGLCLDYHSSPVPRAGCHQVGAAQCIFGE